MDTLAYALSKKFTEETAIAFGAVKGANAVVKSIVHENGQNVITFEWKNNSDQTRESVMYVPDGHDGKGIVSITKTSTSGLIDTYTILFTDNTITTFNVANGAKGLGIKSTAIDANGHLIITYDDNTTEDAGTITILNDNTSSNTTTYSSQKIESMFAELISRIVWVGTHDQWEALSAADKAKYLNVYFTDDAGEDLPIAEEQNV